MTCNNSFKHQILGKNMSYSLHVKMTYDCCFGAVCGSCIQIRHGLNSVHSLCLSVGEGESLTENFLVLCS